MKIPRVQSLIVDVRLLHCPPRFIGNVMAFNTPPELLLSLFYLIAQLSSLQELLSSSPTFTDVMSQDKMA